ncbi:MAG: endolytic transglycosylase MltG, partial [Acidimicrobiales bacterium]
MTGTTIFRHGAEPDGRPPRRGLRWLLGILAVVVVVSVAAGAGALIWYQRQVDPGGPPGDEVALTIPLGTSTEGIAQMLEDRGVIGSATAWRVYVARQGAGPFQAGDYTFRRSQAFAEVVAVLDGGGEVTFDRLTVPEGLTLPQIAARIAELPGRSAERFLALANSGEIRSRYQPAGSGNLEGLLFPDTYFIEAKDDERALLDRMVRRFDEVATQAGIDRAQQAVGMSPYQAIVVASLIERETRFADERAKVARVIHNRLERGQLLQIDATVIYALGKSADSNVRVLDRDLLVDSPYNTYKVKGLPPGPVAAPGRAALEAAVNPTPGPWLFYVVVELEGRHAFATTAAEHQANIN